MPKTFHSHSKVCLAAMAAAAFWLTRTDASPAAEQASRRQAVAAASSQAHTQTASLKDQLLSGLRPITIDDFRGPDEAKPLSLQDIAFSVLKNNHAIRVATHKPDQAQAAILEARAAYDPEAFTDWQHSRNKTPASIASGRRKDSEYRNDTERVGIRQHLPTGGKLSAYREWNQGTERNSGYPQQRGHGGAYALELSQPLLKGFGDKENRTLIEISRLQFDISEEELRQVMIKSLADSMEAYWAVALAAEEVRIHQDTLDMAKKLLAREQERQRKGVSTPLDVHRAGEAVATRTANLYHVREQQQVAQERLKMYINSPEAPIGTDVRIIPTENLETTLMRADLHASIEAALANRPEMRNADLVVRAGEARRSYAKHNLLPQLNVGGTLRRNDRNTSTPTSTSSTDTLGTDWTMGVSLSVPIGNMKSRAVLQRAESELSQSIDERKNTQSIVITEVRTAVQTLGLVVNEIPVTRQAAEAARKVVDGEWARFELNQVGNRDLLQAQDLLSVAERSRVQALVRYNVAMIQLFAAEGTLLDHMGIKLR